MVPSVSNIVKAICPDFPDDRNIRESHDRMSWYVIGNQPATLYIPPISYLKTNPIELDRCAEAIKNFSLIDTTRPEYDWENLNLKEFSGGACARGLVEMTELVAGKEVAVDIETRCVPFEDNKLLSIGFAWDDNTCYAFYDIPIKGTNSKLPESTVVYNLLQEALSLPETTYIWHNGKFDTTRLKYLCDLDARVDEDTMLKHYACINERKGTHGLKELGQLYLQAPAWDDELDKIKRDWCKANKVKLSEFMYDDIPTDVLIPYMQRDCIATLRLHNKFKTLARAGSDFTYRMLIRASKVYGQVELNGIQVDCDYLEDLDFDLEMQIKSAQKHLDEVASKIWDVEQYRLDTGAKTVKGESFNIKSPKQLKWMLSKVLNYRIESTDAATIEALLRECEHGYIVNTDAKEFLESIGTLRKANKYMDTYVQGIKQVICRDGRVRCTYNLHGTETGRLSCSEPNMQNIPRNAQIKNIFISKPGYKMLQLDYSQAELRVLAMLSQDPFMIESYQRGQDFHDAVAEKMFGPAFDKEQRNLAKTINFGIAYGRGPGSIAESFNKTMAEARKIIDDWYRPMPKVREYINSQRRKPSLGEPCVTLLGRERHFIITTENINHVQNEYINTPIQSLASDFTMLSLMEISDYIDRECIDAKIVATVHDSIILEVLDDDELVNKVAAKCIDIMATVPSMYIEDNPVPFKADADVGYKWGGLKKWDI